MIPAAGRGFLLPRRSPQLVLFTEQPGRQLELTTARCFSVLPPAAAGWGEGAGGE